MYQVIAASCFCGKLNKILNGGEVYPAESFGEEELASLISGGYIAPVEKDEEETKSKKK